jgi:hypothetical protein
MQINTLRPIFQQNGPAVQPIGNPARLRLAAQEPNAGDRTEADVRASTLLALAA